MEQVDKASTVHKSIKTVEDNWGIHTKVVESGYINTGDNDHNLVENKFLSTRTISIPYPDIAGAKDPNVALLVCVNLIF